MSQQKRCFSALSRYPADGASCLRRCRQSAGSLGRAFFLLLLCVLLFPARAEDIFPSTQIRPGDLLCFGTPDETCGFDGKWLVLDAAHTSMGTEGMFLVSLNLIGDSQGNPLLFRDIGDVSVSFSNRGEAYALAHPGVTDYQGSDLQRWCSDFLTGHFSEAEQRAILPTTKSDDGISIPGFGIPLPGAAGGTVDFDPADSILCEDRLFPLSAEEAVNEAYGFTDNASRVALFKGTASGYWLRSPHIPTFPLDVGFVFSFGAVMDYPVNAKSMFDMPTYARLGCNLDSSSITELERLSSSETKTIWRVTFQGDRRNEQTYDLTLPEIQAVPDIQQILSVTLTVIPLLLMALIGWIVFLIVRRIRKKKRLRTRTTDPGT